MKFNKKGQGSLEYLMILAAVLAIAVVVVVLASSFLSRQRLTANINEQKLTCGQKGIEIKNYEEEFPTSVDQIISQYEVSYQGILVNAPGGVAPNCSTSTDFPNPPSDPAGSFPKDDYVSIVKCEVGDPAAGTFTIEAGINASSRVRECTIYDTP
jgi:hypothetical protein